MTPLVEAVTPSDEVRKGELHGIVSLYDLVEGPGDAFERHPERVLRATFPSQALRRTLQRLARSTGRRSAEDRKGVFEVAGGYGSGKSHLLLVLHHVLQSPDAAQLWLERHALPQELPSDAVVALLPMAGMSTREEAGAVDFLWEPIFSRLNYADFQYDGSNYPAIQNIRAALDGRTVVLIVDEIERWLRPQAEGPQREANLTFLQNLLEYAQDPDNGLFLFITLLGIEPSVVTAVGRADRFREDLTGAPDRRDIVVHRLVERADEAAGDKTVDAYIALYRELAGHLPLELTQYRQEMRRCYPFHPATLELVFDRYSSVALVDQQSYQNSRGAMRLLAEALRRAVGRDGSPLAGVDLILPGDLSLADEGIRNWVNELDPALSEKAVTNVEASDRVPLAVPVLSTVFLHSLGDPHSTRRLGAAFSDVLLGTLRPERPDGNPITANDVLGSLKALDDTAVNLHPEGDRWVLRAAVAPTAEVNRRAGQKEYAPRAGDEVARVLKEQLGGTERIVVWDQDEIPDRQELVYVILRRQLKAEQVLSSLYRDRASPNALVLIEPQDDVDVLADPDAVRLARRKLAAHDLALEASGETERWRQFRDIEKRNEDMLVRHLTGRYGRWLVPVHLRNGEPLTFRPVNVALRKGDIDGLIRRQYGPAQFQEAVLRAVPSDSSPRTVGEVRAEFYRQRAYPKPVEATQVDAAVQALVVATELAVSKGGDAPPICGKDPLPLARDHLIRLARDEDKPTFDVREAVRAAVTGKTEGVKVYELRTQCKGSAKREGVDIGDVEVDTAVVGLVGTGELELDGHEGEPASPLSPDVRVRPIRILVDIKEQASLAPGIVPIGQAKTLAVKLLGPRDRISRVRAEYHQELASGELDEGLRAIMGLTGVELARGTKGELTWKLSDLPVENRDQLLEFLNRLPDVGGQVNVHYQRQPAEEE